MSRFPCFPVIGISFLILCIRRAYVPRLEPPLLLRKPTLQPLPQVLFLSDFAGLSMLSPFGFWVSSLTLYFFFNFGAPLFEVNAVIVSPHV